jgi:hypothetical protein
MEQYKALRGKPLLAKLSPDSETKEAVGHWFLEGFTIVHTVMMTNDTIWLPRDIGIDRQAGHYHVFAIVREDIQPFFGSGYHYTPPPSDRKIKIDDFEKLSHALEKYRDFARDANDYIEMRSFRNAKFSMQMAEKHRRVIHSIAPGLANGLLAFYLATGRLLGDVHAGNVGWRIHKEFGETGTIVCFDPGFTKTKKSRSPAVQKRIRGGLGYGVMV